MMKKILSLTILLVLISCDSAQNTQDPCSVSNLLVNITIDGDNLTAQPVGGVAPYSFTWSNGATDQALTDLPPGNYSVTVADQNGCTVSGSITLTYQCDGLSIYPQIAIGSQIWMQKNLDVCFYRNGDPIPQITNCDEWFSATTGAWCYANFDSANGPVYGKLYNQYAVADPRGLAPAGWHIPNLSEWATLDNYLGGFGVAGGKMKSVSGWNVPNVGATNSSGFTALPAGGIALYCVTNFGIGQVACFWMYPWLYDSQFPGSITYRGRALEANSTTTDDMYIEHTFNGLNFTVAGLSVRCIKD